MKLDCRRRLPLIYSAIAMLAMSCGPAVSAQNSASPSRPISNYSGMYAFLRDGEFVQLNLEDDGHLTGFVSRYGESESDRGVFLDQFFKQAKLEENRISFTTGVVHGVWFEFKGTVEHGENKNPGEQGYYFLKGILTQTTMDDSKKTASKSREVILKSFPRDLIPPQ